MLEETLLKLINVKNAEKLFLKKSIAAQKKQQELARFLAAYFLNLPLIGTLEEHQCLPNLFKWTQCADTELFNGCYMKVDRRIVTSKLSPELSPKAVLLLLIKSELLLEAILYADHFNDFRSTLILRFYADLVLKLNTFSDALNLVTDNVCNLIDTFNNQSTKADEVFSIVSGHVESIVQLGVVFAPTIVQHFEASIICEIELLFAQLTPKVPATVSLPRPPIYAFPALVQGSVNPECIIWNKIHILIRFFIGLLLRTNRFQSVLAKAMLLTNKEAARAESPADLSSNDTDNESLEESLDRFYCLTLTVLRIHFRDVISLAEREGYDNVEYLEGVNVRLFPSPECQTNEEVLKDFIHNSDEVDAEMIFMFLHYLLDNHRSVEVYLPPLSDANLPQWRSAMITTKALSTNTSCEVIPMWMSPKPLSLNYTEIAKLKFLSLNFKTLSLLDPTLIQICLRLNCDDICNSEQFTVANQLQQFEQASETLLTEKTVPPKKNEHSSRVRPKRPTTKRSRSASSSEGELDLLEKSLMKERTFLGRLVDQPTSHRIVSKSDTVEQRPLPFTHRPLPSVPYFSNAAIVPLHSMTFAEVNTNLKESLEMLGQRLNLFRGLPDPVEQPGTYSISALPQTREEMQHVVEQQQQASGSRSSTDTSSRSRRLKEHSSARQKRERHRMPTYTSCDSVSSIPSDYVCDQVPSTSTHSHRPKDYLQDMTILPTPALPDFEKLNFKELHSPVEKLEERPWQEIEVFSPLRTSSSSAGRPEAPKVVRKSGIQLDAPNLCQERRVDAPEPLQPSATPSYPEWLRLIPPCPDKDSGRPNTATASLRLLDLDAAIKSNRSARSWKQSASQHEGPGFRRHDSGFMEELLTPHQKQPASLLNSEHSAAPALSYNMSDQQIRQLMELCN